MNISQLYITQRKLKRVEQIPTLVNMVIAGKSLPPVRLSEDKLGIIQIDDGHHRIVAYILGGRIKLESWEYDLLFPRRIRPRFGTINNLMQWTRFITHEKIQ